MSIAPRSSLLTAKLRSLVIAHWGDGDRAEVDFPGGAALVYGDQAWLLIDADPLKAFGPALVWSARNSASRLHLLVDSSAEVLARRATCFRDAPTIWQVDEATLAPVVPAPPAPPVAAPPAPELAGLLVDADLEVGGEEGLVRGEVNGLEVARIVHGTTSTGIEIDAPLLEVGVGFADREMTAMLHGSLSPVDQLARVADIVRQHRRPGAQRHPLNQMAPERWLRAVLVRNPGRLGLSRLVPVAPATPRPNLKDTAVAMAEGETAAGERVVVACSVGADLSLVPEAADVRLALDPAARLLLVVPERDAHPVTAELADRLHHRAEVVAVDDGWRDDPSQ
ncbi:MAG: hypothetical protein ACT452_15395 [Microthrixaceae bacterium]